jgi:CRISPR system Cascade subunit CasC
MSHKFVNIHELISHNPSCLNRDDMNMQKSAVFGGVRRARISSQCLKRAFRFSPTYKELLGDKSLRTLSTERLVEYIKEAMPDVDEDIIAKAVEKGMPGGTVVTPWLKEEIQPLLKAILTYTISDKDGIKIDDKKVKLAMTEFIKSGISSVDVALSGRMCASGVLDNVEAAMSMAHAITTHAMEAEIDWFTAMDDLKEEADDAGAGHLNTQEFGAGVFYQYASVNIDLLAKNLGSDRKNALDIISRYLRVMATTTPTGKQHSFASHSLALFILISVSEMPLSLANAFENPVKKGRDGYVLSSVEAILDHWGKVHKSYEINEDVAIFCIDSSTIKKLSNNLKIFETMRELQEWVKKED